MCPNCISRTLFYKSVNLLVFKIQVLALEVPIIFECGLYVKVGWGWKVYE
jgi:hypothetical protein